MIQKTFYSVNAHFSHLYLGNQQQNGMLPILTKMTLHTRGISLNERFYHVFVTVEIDIDFEFRRKTLSVLKMSPSKHTCKEFKKSLINVGQQSTWLGPLPLSERLQTIKFKSIQTKNILHSGRRVQFQILWSNMRTKDCLNTQTLLGNN